MYEDNYFYDNGFDQQRYEGPRAGDYRTPFQRDRDRIVHSSAFRRLQAKTQIFLPGEYDFYRTRLTHSLEVAQIGTSICTYLSHQNIENRVLPDKHYIDRDLVEGICLAHDVGHPPFGHAGERSLHKCLQECGGFEGNAQTLRIIMETIGSDKDIRSGMNPCRAFMDGVMKYKTIYDASIRPANHFLYSDQRNYRDFIFGHKLMPGELEKDELINHFQSIECQIMNWADDIAYALGDMSDGIKSGFITINKLERWAGSEHLDDFELGLIKDLQKAIGERTVRMLISGKVGHFVRSTSLQERQNFLSGVSNRYRYELQISPDAKKEVDLYRKISKALIFKTPSIQQLDHKGGHIISRLFEELHEVYVDSKTREGLLPTEVENAIKSLPQDIDKIRKIGDYLAGMTDGFAIRMYKRLFDPQFGSITDLVDTG